MARPLAANRFAATLSPLSLDELDKVAGGLQDPDQYQVSTDAAQIAQTADGAFFAQTGGTADISHQQADSFVQDVRQDGVINQTDDQQVSVLAGDIADGKLDDALGTFVQVVGQLDPAKNAEQIGQLSTALLDRYADFSAADRPAVLAGLLDLPGFQPDKLIALADGLIDEEPRVGLDLLAASVEAFDDAGRAAAVATLRGEFTIQLDAVLAGAVKDDLAGAELDAVIGWAGEAAETALGDHAAWQMVDSLLDLPATDQIDGHLANFVAEALKGDINPGIIGRLLAEGVVTPAGMMTGLLQNYDALTDTPSGFETQLKAIAAASGDAGAAFSALIPSTVFTALGREAIDGKLDSAEAALAARLLLADRTLPVGDLPDAVLGSVFTTIGILLSKQVSAAGSATAQTAAFLPTALVLRELGAAGPEATAAALAMMLRYTNTTLHYNMASIIRSVGDTPGAALATMIAFDTHPSIVGWTGVSSALNGAMGEAVVSGSAVSALAAEVLSGRLSNGEAEKMISDLALRGELAKGTIYGTGVTDAFVALRQAELAAELIEAGGPDAPALLKELKADLSATPSPLITAIVQIQSRIGLGGALQELAMLADAADMDIGVMLSRVFTDGGVNIKDIAATAIAGLIGKGELTADEARAVARTTFEAIETASTGDWMIGRIAGEMGEARLVMAAERISTTNLESAAQLRELRDEFRALVVSGEAAMGVIRGAEAWGVHLAPQIIALITMLGDAADVFTGSLFVDVLTTLGNAGRDGTPLSSSSWQYRDALRGEVNRVLTGDAATQASWVAGLRDAVASGNQSSAEIVAELELVVEHAFAREGLSRDNNHWNIQEPARVSMRAVWDGLDRLVAATGVALLAAAPASAAARDDALEWFRAQTPSGQVAILNALPASHAEGTALRTIAAQQLDNFDWAAERQRVDQTITVGDYVNSSKWVVFKAEQARDDIRGAVSLAALVGESQLDVIVDMAKAWGLVAGGAAAPENVTIRSSLAGAVGHLSFDVLNSASGRAALANGMAMEVKTGEASTVQVLADITTVVKLATDHAREGVAIGGNTNAYYHSAVEWRAIADTITADFTKALTALGLPNAAVVAFMARVDSGAALQVVVEAREAAPAALARLAADATAAGVSVDYVLVALLDRDMSLRSTEAAMAMLQSRIASDEIIDGLRTEIRQGDMTATKAIEVLKDAADHAKRSFGELLAEMIDDAQKDTANPLVYALLGAATQAMGGAELARLLGADVVADRIGVDAAVAAVLEIAEASKIDRAGALATLVAGSKGDGAEVAAAAIEKLDALLDAKAIPVGSITAALASIRVTLAGQGLSLDTADTEALSALVELFTNVAVSHGDIGGLIDMFDGKVPDAALVALYDKLEGMTNNASQNELELLISQRLAERIESGALFKDAVPAQAAGWAYPGIFLHVEKAVAIASYATYFAAAENQGAALAHARAEALVKESAAVHHATGAFQLYQAARDADTNGGNGLVQWMINSSDQINRDVVFGGLWLDMASKMGTDGTVPADAAARYSAMQAELLEPELKVAEDQRRAALGNPALRDQVSVQAAAAVAAEIGRITDKYAALIDTVTHSSAAAAVLTGDPGADLRSDIVSKTATWVVIAGSAANSYLTGGPAGLALSAATALTGQLMKVEGFRDAIGEGIAMPIQLALQAIEMGRSVVVAAVNTYMNSVVSQR